MGDEADLLLEALQKDPVTSIRLNRRKPVVEFMDTEPVEWCPSGLYLKERPEFIFDPLMHAGAYYVQDASSMIYETVMERLLDSYFKGKGAGIHLLDLCAAPGGKTTAMINALPDGCKVVANEYSPKRVGALKENLERWDYPDVTVTNRDSRYFAAQGPVFDIVAVDAPCSGEGMMRKDETARSQWSLNLVKQCASLQKEILKNAIDALKPGGVLIYSTCTFNRHENEENAEWIVKEQGLAPVDLDFPPAWGIPRGIATDLPVYRFMPHKTRGEGLFLAVFKKPESISDSPAMPKNTGLRDRSTCEYKNNRKNGKNKAFVENDSVLPCVEVDRPTAIRYLQGESIVLPPEAPLGIVKISYRGLGLGQAKNIGSRANNLYPKNRRILKR